MTCFTSGFTGAGDAGAHRAMVQPEAVPRLRPDCRTVRAAARSHGRAAHRRSARAAQQSVEVELLPGLFGSSDDERDENMLQFGAEMQHVYKQQRD